MFKLADLQGNILRGYTKKPYVRYLVLEVADPSAARRWLAGAVSGRDGVPQITSGDWGANKPDTCFNIGLTYEGLRALGTPASSLKMFPNEFIEGMTARAWKLGDVGRSAPENWPAPFNEPKRIHLIATIYAEEAAQLDDVQQRALADGKAWTLLGTREGYSFPDDIVHFGYRDNIMQPRFEGIHDPQRHADGQPMAPLGTVLLGHPTNLEGLMWRVPATRSAGTQRHLQRLSRAEAGRGGLRELSRPGRVLFARAPAGRRGAAARGRTEHLPGPLDRTAVASWCLARGRRRQPVRPMARWHAAGPLGGRACPQIV